MRRTTSPPNRWGCRWSPGWRSRPPPCSRSSSASSPAGSSTPPSRRSPPALPADGGQLSGEATTHQDRRYGPPVAGLVVTPVDEARQRDLRRMKAVATGFLVAAFVIYLVAKANEDRAAWIGYLRAGAEAAMVGALADWFAVTALFRHPLGIPVPHTAIIPRRKDQIGRSLGEFVEQNFLTAEVLTERLEGVEIGKRLGRWLSDPAHASRATAAIGDSLRGAIEVLDDR